ncbi:serine phosphatase RsbU (regulator of sigma subunit) [Streptomyces sp. Amel2xB2]|nr:serine phosphatase RsbU (regulator of sigma subunit) [Streptomyces sp. Amel2xB2]
MVTLRFRPRLLAALPYIAMGIVVLVDVVAGPSIGFLPMMALGPAFAGLIGNVRRSVVIGALALGLSLMLSIFNSQVDDRRGYTTLISVAGVAVAGVAATAMRKRREAELASVRSIAETAQRVLLRPVPRNAGQLRAAVSYTSAMAEARIGGDLYEMVTAPTGVRLIVGDVQSKGLEAVETAAVVVGAFREAAYDEGDLMAVGQRLERALARHLLGEKFVTAVLAEVRERDGATLLNFGHPAPLLIRPDGSVHYAEPPDRALPLGLDLEDGPAPQPHRVPFVPGDQLLFYTDGVSEARDPANRFYPLEERGDLFKDPDPDAALAGVRLDLTEHIGTPPHDDAAMLLLRYRDE